MIEDQPLNGGQLYHTLCNERWRVSTINRREPGGLGTLLDDLLLDALTDRADQRFETMVFDAKSHRPYLDLECERTDDENEAAVIHRRLVDKYAERGGE